MWASACPIHWQSTILWRTAPGWATVIAASSILNITLAWKTIKTNAKTSTYFFYEAWHFETYWTLTSKFISHIGINSIYSNIRRHLMWASACPIYWQSTILWRQSTDFVCYLWIHQDVPAIGGECDWQLWLVASQRYVCTVRHMNVHMSNWCEEYLWLNPLVLLTSSIHMLFRQHQRRSNSIVKWKMATCVGPVVMNWWIYDS